MDDIKAEIAKLVGDNSVGGLRKLLLNEKIEMPLRNEIKAALAAMGTPEANEAITDFLIAQIKALGKHKEEDRMKEVKREKLAKELAPLGTKKGAESLIKWGYLALYNQEPAFRLLTPEAKGVVIAAMMKDFKAKKPYTPPALYSYCKDPSFKQRGQVLEYLCDKFVSQKKIQPKSPEIKYIFEFKDAEGGKYRQDILKAISRWKDFEIRPFNVSSVLPFISPEETDFIEALRKCYQRTDFGQEEAMERGWVGFYLKFGLHDDKNPVTKYGTPEEKAAYKAKLEQMGLTEAASKVH